MGFRLHRENNAGRPVQWKASFKTRNTRALHSFRNASRSISSQKRGRSMRARCRSIMWNTAMSRLLRRKSSTKFRRSLRGASRSAASTAERVFFLPASSAGTAAPTLARKSGTRPQNTAGSSGNATANSRVGTNAERHTWTRKPLKRDSWPPLTLSSKAKTTSLRIAD